MRHGYEYGCDECQCLLCAKNSATCCINRPINCPDMSDYDPEYKCPDFTPCDVPGLYSEDCCPACGGTPKLKTKKGRFRIECGGDCWTQTGWHDTVPEAVEAWRKIRKEREESENNATD